MQVRCEIDYIRGVPALVNGPAGMKAPSPACGRGLG